MVNIEIRQRNHNDKKQMMLQIIRFNGEICNINLPLIDYVKIDIITGKVEIPNRDWNITADKIFINMDWADLDLYNLKINVEDNWYIIKCKRRLDSIIFEAFDKIMHPKCEECGEPLPIYPFYDEQYEIRICGACGHTNLTARRQQ